MKDAKGHGSAAHGGGVDQIGRPPVWYHGSPKAAQIKKSGFSLANVSKNSGSRGITGTGVYITNNMNQAGLYGKVFQAEPNPGLKLFTPKDTISDLFGSHTNYGDPDKITSYYRNQGYDGIHIRGQNGQESIVVFDPKNVKAKS